MGNGDNFFKASLLTVLLFEIHDKNNYKFELKFPS